MAVAYENLVERYRGGNISINKCELCEEDGKVWVSFEFVEGRLLSEMFDELLDKNDQEGFRKLFAEYVERTGYNAEFPVADFDMIFGNIIVQGDEWTIIDYEWTFGKAVEVKEAAFRAIYCYLLEDEKRNKLNLDLILADIGLTEAEAEEFRAQELKFQKFVTGQQKSMSEMRDAIGYRQMQPAKWIERMQDAEFVNRVQIYEDFGEGFSEDNSYFVKSAFQNEQDIEMEVLVNGNVKVLRIDPCMDSCVVTIEEMTFNGKAVPLADKKIFYANGKLLKPGPGAVFPTTDPNLYIKVSDLDMKGENILYVKMTVVRLPVNVAENMAASVKKLI